MAAPLVRKRTALMEIPMGWKEMVIVHKRLYCNLRVERPIVKDSTIKSSKTPNPRISNTCQDPVDSRIRRFEWPISTKNP
uniref:Uncharacterized protein n=1 Tax=Timema poppense TaxID=170557 RepID=A0A7R9D7G4_TIMPO|nr:unnamed protein product [Timema poppensis]